LRWCGRTGGSASTIEIGASASSSRATSTVGSRPDDVELPGGLVLTIVRHGRTAANASGLLLGRADPELDDVGREQALAVGEALRALGSGVRVVCSPLQRAASTAAAIAEACAAVEVRTDERWIELDYGEYDNTPVGSVPAEVWSRWRADPDYAPPGGESLRTLRIRVEDALDEWAAHDDDTIVVTHVSPIKAAVGWALGVGDQVNWRTHVTPGSITRVGLGPAGPVLRSFNEVVVPPPNAATSPAAPATG
jgi:broad specificity phosphatase PhoE